jgi:hypothetical protein
MFLIMFRVFHKIYILLYFLRNVLDQLKHMMIDLEDIIWSSKFDTDVLLEETNDLTQDYHRRNCSDHFLMTRIDSYFHIEFRLILKNLFHEIEQCVIV